MNKPPDVSHSEQPQTKGWLDHPLVAFLRGSGWGALLALFIYVGVEILFVSKQKDLQEITAGMGRAYLFLGVIFPGVMVACGCYDAIRSKSSSSIFGPLLAGILLLLALCFYVLAAVVLCLIVGALLVPNF